MRSSVVARDSTATLIHAIVISSINYCATLLIGSTKIVIDKLQRDRQVPEALVVCTSKFYTAQQYFGDRQLLTARIKAEDKFCKSTTKKHNFATNPQ
jgi:hypothetical protein